MNSNHLKKAMILAAGFGTRLKPLTDNIPKALVEYKGEPMIKRVIRKLEDSGIEEIIINTHHLADKMKEYFKLNKFESKITLLHESEILGTGGAIKNARKALAGEDNFLIYNADIDSEIEINEMMDFHLKQKSLATLAVKDRVTKRYLIVDDSGRVIGRTIDGEQLIFAQKYGHFKLMAFSGIHIISNKLFDYFPPEDNFDIIPVYMDIISKNQNIMAYDMTGIYWKDLGNKINIL